MINQAWDGRRIRLPNWVGVLAGWASTQLVVLFLWSVFRAPQLQAVLMLWQRALRVSWSTHLLSHDEVGLVLLVAAALLCIQLLLGAIQARARIASTGFGVVLRPAYAVLLTIATCYFAIAHTSPHRFIYFQF